MKISQHKRSTQVSLNATWVMGSKMNPKVSRVYLNRPETEKSNFGKILKTFMAKKNIEIYLLMLRSNAT